MTLCREYYVKVLMWTNVLVLAEDEEHARERALDIPAVLQVAERGAIPVDVLRAVGETVSKEDQ